MLKKGVTCNCPDKCEETFEILKKMLISIPIFQLYDVNKEWHLFVDATKLQTGAILKLVDETRALHSTAYHFI